MRYLLIILLLAPLITRTQISLDDKGAFRASVFCDTTEVDEFILKAVNTKNLKDTLEFYVEKGESVSLNDGEYNCVFQLSSEILIITNGVVIRKNRITFQDVNFYNCNTENKSKKRGVFLRPRGKTK